MIKQIIKKTPAYDVWYWIKFNQRNRRELQEWWKSGKPVPPPGAFKQMTVKEYARRFGLTTLIETGTFCGEMVYASKDTFRRIYSIELSEQLASDNERRLGKYGHIKIIQGDSAKVLPGLLSSVHEPCLMWLDAHYSGVDTARGDSDTPIMQELETIFRLQHSALCLLIDDARCFIGQNGYPTLEELEAYVKRARPDWRFELAHDIIRIHPEESS
jgi:hypothetical protein